MRMAIELWGAKDQLLLLRDWLTQEGFEPIVCAAFVEVGIEWFRMENVPVNKAAWVAVAPDVWDQSLMTHRPPLVTEAFVPPRWFSGRPMPQEDVEEPEE